MIFTSSMPADLACSMLLTTVLPGSGKVFAWALFLTFSYKILIIIAAGILICIIITTIACILNNKKIKRESQKENEDAEQK